MMNKRKQTRFNVFSVGMVCLFLALVLVMAAVPTSSASAQKCKYKHTVEAGDTLIYIASLYQVDWRDIVDANSLGPPYVISVGQKLCIPYGEKPSETTTGTGAKKGEEPELTVVPGIGHLLVSVENFSKLTVYYVRIFPQNFPVSYKVGHFKTNKEGDFTGYLNLPSYVPRKSQMTVCVKNVWTDATSCVKVFDALGNALHWYSGSSCNKSAR